jgi:RsiW-degrading membrane proteinase PrsW (M82 family)
LVFSLRVHTFTFVALMCAAALAQVAPGETVAWLLLVVLTVYIFLAMKRFYNQGWLTTTLKFVVISGIYTLFFLLPAMAGILALSFFGGSIG